MKRIVPLLLAVVMVFTMAVSTFGVEYVDELPEGVETRDSAELFDRTVENLFAANGTPTVDGVVDAAWANAFTYINDAGAAAIKMNFNLCHGWTSNTTSGNSEIRLMWDENNLYILEQRFDETYDWAANDKFDNCWSSGDQTNFNIMLPAPMTEFGDVISHQIMFCVPVALTETQVVDGLETVVPKAVGTVAPSIMYGREMQITSYRPSVYKEYVWDLATGKDGAYAGVKSFTAITADGYLQESVIPWSTLCYGNVEADDFKGELGAEFGIKMYMNYDSDTGTKVYHVNQFLMDGTINSSDYSGHAPVKMINSVSEHIKPDYSWYNKDATEFEIADAADLLGLVYLTHSWNKLAGYAAADTSVTLPSKPGGYANGDWRDEANTEIRAPYLAYYEAKIAQDAEGAALVTAGKTFKLTADIDLNPGYTGAANTRPGNIWYGLLNFAGTLDGQGHTIKGLYNDAMYGTGFYDEMGLATTLAATGTIKNVTLEGTFIADSETDKLTDGVAGVKADGATVTNVVTTNLVCAVGDPDDYTQGADETTAPDTTVSDTTTAADTTAADTTAADTTAAGTTAADTDEDPTEAPTAAPTDDKKPDESKGCKSVAGGAVVALLALAAVPAICRKKED